MYKINLNTKSYKIIPEGINPYYNLTYLELEIRNTIEKEIGVIYFFQEELPNCDSKYWKNNNGIIEEMNNIDKINVDSIKELDDKIINSSWKYPQKPIRLSGAVNLFFTGGDYAALMNQLIMRDSIKYYQYNEFDDTGIIYFDYLELLNGLFSLNEETQIISCNDNRLTVEQLYDTGYAQTEDRIYKV